MLFLILLYLSLGSSFALPTPSDLPTDIPPSFFTRSTNILFETRSIWVIISSCLSTIFACTWIGVHPNIPGPGDSRLIVFGRRVAIMGYTLIAPELVIYWATRQHVGAKQLRKQYEERGWTMAHGFFVIMGGFTLHDKQGTALRILESEELNELSEAGNITWPSITEEEILDRSKSDHLSKAIVLLHTSWFITQFIVRRKYGLEVTVLEFTTFAFAGLTGVTYYLWWHKPLNVRCSVPVYLEKSLSEGSQLLQQPLDVADESNPQEPSTIFAPSPNSSPGPNYTALTQRPGFIQRQRQKYGTFLGLIYAFLLHPFVAFFVGFDDMIECDSLHDASPLRVPTFYAPKNDHFPARFVICATAIIGWIHGEAWHFIFPTPNEQLAWKISLAFVSGLPILFSAISYLVRFIDFVGTSPKSKEFFETVAGFAVIALTVPYITARIVLLVLPCLALRALSDAAFVDIQWASFIPHIG